MAYGKSREEAAKKIRKRLAKYKRVLVSSLNLSTTERQVFYQLPEFVVTNPYDLIGLGTSKETVSFMREFVGDVSRIYFKGVLRYPLNRGMIRYDSKLGYKRGSDELTTDRDNLREMMRNRMEEELVQLDARKSLVEKMLKFNRMIYSVNV